jgi:peptidoglycan/LPS O-acetylase OafA/YrhL
MAGLCLLPGVADGLICGLIAAILIKTGGINWARYDVALRTGPLALLLATGALKLVDGDTGTSFDVLSGLTVAIACAMYILAIARGAPEAKRLESRFYCFWGNNSYSIYLTHLAVLGLMHGFILGTKPDVASAPQLAVTLAALPACALAGWILTKLVEQPITNYGRSWRWSEARRQPRPLLGGHVAAAA